MEVQMNMANPYQERRAWRDARLAALAVHKADRLKEEGSK